MSRSFLNQKIQSILETNHRPQSGLALDLVSDVEIKKLNKKFRGINQATDVLSFESGSGLFLGEIVISLDMALAQARELKIPLKDRVLVLLVHGFLHLIGYDHIKQRDRIKMKRRENFILKKIRGGLPGLISSAETL